MPVLSFENKSPHLGQDIFLAPDAWLIGDSHIGNQVSIFFGTVVRGDILPILVGNGTNLQEHVLLHTSHGLSACQVGNNVTVGHRAILHGCSVMDNCIIGMGATILDGAVIGKNSIIGANSLISLNTQIPEGVLAFGSPAKVIRDLTPQEIAEISESARRYREVGAEYRKSFASKSKTSNA